MAISRRDFLKGAAVGAAGVASLGMGSAMAAQETGAYMSLEDLDRKWSFEIPPEPIADSEIKSVKEAEIIVVGAGTAGLCTALSAAEAGVKIILFAMSEGPVARGGSNFAFDSKYRRELGLAPTTAEPFLRNEIKANYFDIDVDKWYKWYNHSEETMNWLIDIMAETEYELYCEQGNRGMNEDDPAYCPPGTHAWISADMRRVGDGQPFVVETLAAKCESIGVEINYKVTAEQLVKDGDRVVAVVAKDAEGNYIKYVGSKAIVLATGDFSTDREMMKKYAPQAYDYITNFDSELDPNNGKVYGGLYKGQGQKMGLWAGAAWQKAYPNAAMMGCFGGASNMPYNVPSGFLCNARGKRFFNEVLTAGFMSKLIAHQPGHMYFQIWDTDYAVTGQPWYQGKTYYGQEVPSPEEMIATWDANAENGQMFKADTLEELCEVMGLPVEATLSEIDRYNGFCETGLDTDFYKQAELLIPIKTGPFYGTKTTNAVFLTVMGGLRTDINCRVCDANDDPIPGLYNVGTMVGDCYAGCYNFQIAGHNYGMNCICFGYLTGKYIAENE